MGSLSINMTLLCGWKNSMHGVQHALFYIAAFYGTILVKAKVPPSSTLLDSRDPGPD